MTVEYIRSHLTKLEGKREKRSGRKRKAERKTEERERQMEERRGGKRTNEQENFLRR